jgi:hypothetical protein
MTIVSNKDFATNHNRYFDLAIDEKVAVKRGDYTFSIVCNFDMPQRKQKILKPDDRLRSAITMDELLVGVKQDLREIFEKGEK